MVDITMCINDKCEARKYCYRYRATPSEYQSYSEFKPERNKKAEGFKCDNWIEYLKHDY